MQTIGTPEAGFSVGLDTNGNVVRVVGWGFWDPDVASDFDRIVIEVCRYVPMGTSVVMDMSLLKPLRDEGQRAFAKTITMLKDSRITKVSVITQSQLTKLQLLRIAREAAPKERVQFI